MNVEIGIKAAQFPDKEYINGIFVAVLNLLMSREGHSTVLCNGVSTEICHTLK
jgi:hypothetical protein